MNTYIAWIIYKLCIPSSDFEKDGLGGSLVRTSLSSLDITDDNEAETIDFRIYRGLVRKVSEETNMMFGNKASVSLVNVDSSTNSDGVLQDL